MARLFITVGIPGTGKTTWAKTFFKEPYAVIVSSDTIREELTGDASDQTRNQEIFDEFHARVRVGLVFGKDVVADSTALDPFARKNLIDIAKGLDAEIHLVVFENVNQGSDRNQRRNRVVPEGAMVRLMKKYIQFQEDLSSEQELYNSITKIRSVS